MRNSDSDSNKALETPPRKSAHSRFLVALMSVENLRCVMYSGRCSLNAFASQSEGPRSSTQYPVRLRSDGTAPFCHREPYRVHVLEDSHMRHRRGCTRITGVWICTFLNQAKSQPFRPLHARSVIDITSRSRPCRHPDWRLCMVQSSEFVFCCVGAHPYQILSVQ